MCISLEGWKARKTHTLGAESSLEFCNRDFYENRIQCWFSNKSVTENCATFVDDYISWVACPPVSLVSAWFKLSNCCPCSPDVHSSVQVCLYVLALQTGFKPQVSYCAALVQAVTNLKPSQPLTWISVTLELFCSHSNFLWISLSGVFQVDMHLLSCLPEWC